MRPILSHLLHFLPYDLNYQMDELSANNATEKRQLGEDEVIPFTKLSGFFPKQIEAQNASKRFKFVLFGGSVGSGKSRWLRWMMVYWLIKLFSKYKIPGIRAGLFCEDYVALNE